MEISSLWAVWATGYTVPILTKNKNSCLTKQRNSLYNCDSGTTKCGTKTRVSRTVVDRNDEESPTRNYITAPEVKKLRVEVRKGRNGYRNETMVYMGYHHGLRCGEIVRLKWNQILWEEEEIQIVRSKHGSKLPNRDLHPLDDWEMKALRALQRAAKTEKGWIFRSERKDGERLSERGFFQILARAGAKAGFDFPVNPHSLRHGCGYRMNDEGRNARSIQAWLGHRDISTTQMYCAMNASYFRREGF